MDPVLNETVIESLASIIKIGQLAAAFAVLNGIVVGLGQGLIAAKAVESVARQPEASGKINSTMLIGAALSETSAIYGLLISIILLFANPLVSRFVALVGL